MLVRGVPIISQCWECSRFNPCIGEACLYGFEGTMRGRHCCLTPGNGPVRQPVEPFCFRRIQGQGDMIVRILDDVHLHQVACFLEQDAALGAQVTQVQSLAGALITLSQCIDGFQCRMVGDP